MYEPMTSCEPMNMAVASPVCCEKKRPVAETMMDTNQCLIACLQAYAQVANLIGIKMDLPGDIETPSNMIENADVNNNLAHAVLRHLENLRNAIGG